jgi:hypothetical protein
VIVGQFIVTWYCCEPVQPELSVANSVNVYVPDAVGVPDKTPADDNVNPVGSVPELLL